MHENDRPHAPALPLLGAIAGVIRWIEELVSLLSGPLLSVGLAIALIDLLTGGGLLRSFPELLYAWGVCQAVGIDAQLVATWDRCRLALRAGHWWTAIGLVVLGVALGYVGFLSAEAFGLQQAFGLSESDALARLGIDAASWQLQRAILAVFLVALSGFTRYHAPPKAKQSLEDERAALAREIELEPLRQRLRAQKAVGGAALVRQALSAAAGREPAGVPVVNAQGHSGRLPDPTGPGSPQVESEPESRERTIVDGKIVQLPARPRSRSGARKRRAKGGVRSVDSYEQPARAAFAAGATSVAKMRAAVPGISQSAASGWVRTLKAEAAPSQQQEERETIAL
jgi:hypothetical protein